MDTPAFVEPWREDAWRRWLADRPAVERVDYAQVATEGDGRPAQTGPVVTLYARDLASVATSCR